MDAAGRGPARDSTRRGPARASTGGEPGRGSFSMWPRSLIRRARLPVDSTRQKALRRRVTYLMLFRLVLISLVLGATLWLSWLSDVDLGEPNSLVLIGIIVTTYVLTIIYALVLRRAANPERLADVQLCVDLVTSALLVHVTGGAQSAYTFFFPLSIIAAAAIRFRQGAVVVAVASMVVFSTVSALGWLEVLPSFVGQRLVPSALSTVEFGRAMALNLAAIAAVAVLAYNLGGQIQQTTASLETQRTATADLEAVHEDIIRSLSSGLITVDLGGAVLTINRTACEILSIDPAQAVGAPIEGLLPGFAAMVLDRAERDVLRRADLVIPRPDGGQIILGLTVSPLRNNRDQALGRIIHFQDLTELYQMEQQMRQAERLAMVGTLAAGVAHEIRNPLAAISGSIELLRQDERGDSDEGRALMDIVTREVDRLDTLITELLDYTNPQPRELVSFDLPALTREALAVFEQDRTYQGVSVAVAGDSDPGPVDMVADPDRVRQVLWNLLRNGAEAATGQVTVRVKRDGSHAIIDVIDDGPGIAPEHLERVFEPFFTTKSQGTGLGLATCHSILHEQGGTIQAENLAAGGCRFRVRLPLDAGERSSRHRLA